MNPTSVSGDLSGHDAARFHRSVPEVRESPGDISPFGRSPPALLRTPCPCVVAKTLHPVVEVIAGPGDPAARARVFEPARSLDSGSPVHRRGRRRGRRLRDNETVGFIRRRAAAAARLFVTVLRSARGVSLPVRRAVASPPQNPPIGPPPDLLHLWEPPSRNGAVRGRRPVSFYRVAVTSGITDFGGMQWSRSNFAGAGRRSRRSARSLNRA